MKFLSACFGDVIFDNLYKSFSFRSHKFAHANSSGEKSYYWTKLKPDTLKN